MRALFCDFDGLICDTERAALAAWRELYLRLGQVFPASLWPLMAGNSSGAGVALADLAARLGRQVSPAELAWQRGRKAELADTEPERPGVTAVLDAAHRLGMVVAVVSSSPAHWVCHHLARLGLRDRFAFAVTGEDAPRHKPAPHLYQVALRRAGVDAAAALALEDSAIGILAAKAAGIACVAVPHSRGVPVGEAGPVLEADAVLESLELLDLGGWT
jgi:putative hydrolase of the HAD superfamily